MTALLAQADEANAFVSQVQRLFESMTAMFSRGDALAQGDTLVADLQNLGAVWAIVFLIVGCMCLINGFRFYKAATIAVAGAIGMFGGYWLGQHIDAPFIVAGALGLLLAVVAFPLMKYAVAVFGGLAGAFIGANLWAGIANAINASANKDVSDPAQWNTVVPEHLFWIGALIGLLVCGMLAFVLFKLSVVMFTSVSGSTLAVLGLIALLLSFEPWRDPVSSGITANKLIVPLLVLVPAVIGLILQEYRGAGAGNEEPKPA